MEHIKLVKIMWSGFLMFTESNKKWQGSVSVTSLRVAYNFELCCGDVVDL